MSNSEHAQGSSEEKLYAVGERDCWKLGEHYARHVQAMTVEGLHSKSDIAAELAVRDAEIERLTRQRDSFDHQLDLKNDGIREQRREIERLRGALHDAAAEIKRLRSSPETTAPQAPIAKITVR